MMLLFWRWKEVHFGSCVQTFAAVRNLLGAHGIRYEYRIVDQTYKGRMAGTHRGRTHFGNAGIHFDTTMLYYVYVRNQDYENARYA
ncbi:hypothetical protein [Hydrogenoanaerobacterium sp.]|uniref:hypothetical protein n=1 Tax=Hydrogenoanaerobacterium sp. TaxID=2953763 RepID=UPI00289F00F2|nr:hypothetical protein [Hydrogenoanaerobacterium sp.]